MADFFERLKGDKPVIIDGGTGTEMEKRGAKMEDKGWSASCTLTAPDLLRSIHEDYIKAGAEVIITNTFSTAKHVLGMRGAVVWALAKPIATHENTMIQNIRDMILAPRNCYVG